jgi:hypothetical protein
VGVAELAQAELAVQPVALPEQLGAPDGRLLSRPPGGDAFVLAEASEQTREVLGVVPLKEGRVALRAANGQFVAAPPGAEEVVAGPVRAGRNEAFRVEGPRGNPITYWTADGRRLGYGRDGRLRAEPRKGSTATFVRLVCAV